MRLRKKTRSLRDYRGANNFPRLARWLAMFASAALLSCGVAQALGRFQSSAAHLLTLGAASARELTGGQSHRYRLALTEGQYLRLVVEQRGIDVVVALAGADGVKVRQVDSPNGTVGPEELHFIAKASGQYWVTVSSLEEKAPAGKYEIKISDLRPASASDASLVAGETALAEADGLMGRGDLQLMRQAISKYAEAAEAYRAADAAAKEAWALYQISRAYLSFGEAQKALEPLNRFLLLSRQTKDAAREAMAFGALGAAWLRLGERRKALDYFQQSLTLGRQAGSISDQAVILSNMGTISGHLGELDKALMFYSEALAALQQASTSAANAEHRRALRWAEANILINVASARHKLGDFQMAIDTGNQVLSIIREQRGASTPGINDRKLEGVALNIVALALSAAGETQKPLEYNLESLRILEQIGDQRNQAVTLNDIGLIYQLRGDQAQAVRSFQQSLALAKRVNDPVAQSVALQHLGWSYEALGERDKALASLAEALTLTRAATAREDELVALRRLGAIYLRSGDQRRAIEHLQLSLQISRALKQVAHEAATQSLLAQAHRELGALSQALASGEAALRITESLRAGVASQDRRSTFFSAVQDRYASHIETLMQLHGQYPTEDYAATALAVSERARARGLLELLAESRVDIRVGVETGLLERERHLHRQINAKAEAQSKLLNSKHTEEQAAAFTNELADLTAQLQEVQTAIRRASPPYAALMQPQPLAASDVQRLLDDQTVLLEYALGEKSSYLWAVTPTAINSYQLPPGAEIETAARKVYDLLTARQPPSALNATQQFARVKQAEAAYPTQAAALSRMLLAPIAGQLGRKRLVIVASGMLEYLPFAALPDPSTANKTTGVPLLVNHEVINLPSASTLAVLRREAATRTAATKSVAVLADPVFTPDDPRIRAISKNRQTTAAVNAPAANRIAPASAQPTTNLARAVRDFNFAEARGGLARLPFSREEAETILALEPRGAGFKALSFAANRQTATSPELGQYRVVHFATHGLLNSEHPELSGLVFSLVDETGQPQDGFLRLHEIFNLRLSADLIVLSACQTALGKQIRGEGLVGLTRGFMYAGTTRVMASLWQVNDLATAELMKHFYRGLLKDGLRPAAALRAAQLELLKGKQWRQPYYWAAFVLQGEWR